MVGGNPPDRRGKRPGNADGFRLPWDEDQGGQTGQWRATPPPPPQQRPGPQSRPAAPPQDPYTDTPGDEYESGYQDPYGAPPPAARRGPFPPQRQQPAPQQPPPRRPPAPQPGYSEPSYPQTGQQPAYPPAGQPPGYQQTGQQPVYPPAGLPPGYPQTGQQPVYPPMGQQAPYPQSGQQPASPRRQPPPPADWESGGPGWETPPRPQRAPAPAPWADEAQPGYLEEDYPDGSYLPTGPTPGGRGERGGYPPLDDEWEDDRPIRGRSGRAPQRQRPQVSVPPALTGALQAADMRVLAVGAGSVLSVLLMAAFGAVRIEALPDWFPMHYAANGVVDVYGSGSALWRLPLGLGVLTAMNIGAGVLLGSREKFASLLFFGSLVLIHVVAWLAFVQIAF